jgi:hypothetical protein
MKRLVLLGEGQGDVSALPVLVRRLLKEKDADRLLFVDKDVIRQPPSRLVKWDKATERADYSQWISWVEVAARRRDVGGLLAVYDGDFAQFPAGSPTGFCAATAAKSMAGAAVSAGAGKLFSISVVFVCPEYETWLVAGAESLAGRKLEDGRLALPRDFQFPVGDPESHAKGWLQKHCPGYRPSRDQASLTELLDLQVVRSKKLRSFQRLEHAIEQLADAAGRGSHVSTPR